ncbi:hypothetical protein BUALT_Bualt09G0105100 [Buddleja alternifolia]|uniref:Protein downstream neighbor of Son n=1 Tax=Buddleja alternifolia TaxID=168488 RepID=A0AAV6X9L8_9LAMI|nr:hypothetical protein BUALT_Bualt09G0105100 [Buddleja alternifolia]
MDETQRMKKDLQREDQREREKCGMCSWERMTKVAAAGELPSSNALCFGGGVGGSMIPTANLKRKTPSELRGELMKSKNPAELGDESPGPITSFIRNADEAVSGPKKSDSLKAPRFTRMDEHYPVTKTSRLFSRKENPKDTVPGKFVSNMKNISLPMDLNTKCQVQNSCLDNTVVSEGGCDHSNHANISTEKCSTNIFKSVRELSLGSEKLNGSSSVDMGKALKGLVAREPHAASASLSESIDRTGNIMHQSFCSEFHTSGHKIPLDLTLKTNMRLVSSSSVNWFHRLINCGTLNGMGLLSYVGTPGQTVTSSSEPFSASHITSPGTFHSWVHPQSTLPRAAISALTSASGGQMDFLSKRQQAWEDSFRSLYYMLRKKICKLFYVCCAQFVVMFAASNCPNETKCSCYAYVSQSTRNLRSLLKEHDVSFSMPLCYSKVEEVTAEDLVELSEIQKHNLGQARAIETMTSIDNSPQSLLMFTGNKNVHALYDLLLNYRSFFSSLTGGDVPLLYSPVPFENAAISTPEVRCKEIKKVDYISSQLKESDIDTEPNRGSSPGICFSVEIRDSYLPPWVISGICSAMCSNGGDFQASFVTESTSIGLNVGLDRARDQTTEQVTTDNPLESDHSFGIPSTNLSLQRHSAFLKGLKYGGGSYTSFLSPIE